MVSANPLKTHIERSFNMITIKKILSKKGQVFYVLEISKRVNGGFESMSVFIDSGLALAIIATKQVRFINYVDNE